MTKHHLLFHQTSKNVFFDFITLVNDEANRACKVIVQVETLRGAATQQGSTDLLLNHHNTLVSLVTLPRPDVK